MMKKHGKRGEKMKKESESKKPEENKK